MALGRLHGLSRTFAHKQRPQPATLKMQGPRGRWTFRPSRRTFFPSLLPSSRPSLPFFWFCPASSFVRSLSQHPACPVAPPLVRTSAHRHGGFPFKGGRLQGAGFQQPKSMEVDTSVVSAAPGAARRPRSRAAQRFVCHRDICTWPVWWRLIARAAAGDKSMSRPRTKGPRSLIRTVTHPSWQTLTSVPKGSERCAAV